MMSKSVTRRTLSHIKHAPYWLFLIAALFLFMTSIFALRANNQKMLELRAAVFAADELDGDIEGSLRALREHVYTHMNTDLAVGDNAIRPPIQLKYRYERLVGVEQEKLQAGSSGDIYAQAQSYCEQKFPSGFSGSSRLPCIREYLDANGAQVTEDTSIPEDLYKFDFVSPRWSPDLAGLSLVGGVLCLVAFVLFAGSELLLKQRLRQL